MYLNLILDFESPKLVSRKLADILIGYGSRKSEDDGHGAAGENMCFEVWIELVLTIAARTIKMRSGSSL
jgi:hypothetical protein